MSDPDSEWGTVYNPDVVAFGSITSIPCLVLLGEPGMGKSITLGAELSKQRKEIDNAGDTSFFLDLRSVGTENRLTQEIFKHPTFASWRSGSQKLHLFLDSLDECLLRIDHVTTLLTDELRKFPVERLNFRVACRTGEWRVSFENELLSLWGGEDKMGVYELAPLRRVDVATAAEGAGLDPESFLEAIERAESVPLAIRPVTLNFLINAYRRDGRFPPKRADLYLKGCRILAEEPSERRRESKLARPSASEILAIAYRIAAVTTLSNRYSVWTGADQGDVPAEDVTIRDLSWGEELVEGRRLPLSEEAVKDALSSGLFSSRGPNRSGWSHQTYAEFLAARYLVERGFTLTQMMSLLTNTEDKDQRIVPQLHETASWLSSMVPEVFREVMKRDPEVLYRSDVATAEPEDREALVGALLDRYAKEELLDRLGDTQQDYPKLAHPRLASQLRSYISDTSQGIIVRRVAINIAEACQLRELQSDLLQTALDSSNPLPIRVEATTALAAIADDDTKMRLKPLLLHDIEEDESDELKGALLRALWPSHLTAEELFGILTPPKQHNLVGLYAFFLGNSVLPHLPVDALPKALQWAEEQLKRHAVNRFDALIDGIIYRAWTHLDLSGIAPALARVAVRRLEEHDTLVATHGLRRDRREMRLGDELANDDHRRRMLLDQIIPLISKPRDAIWLVFSTMPVALSKDLSWLLERLTKTTPTREQEVLVQIIRRVFDWHDPVQVEAIYKARESNSLLADAFRADFEAILLGSPEAEKLRKEYEDSKAWDEERNRRPTLDPPPKERIRRLLEQCESGNLDAFWILNRELTLEPHSTHYGDELEPDLTPLPGWVAADEITRARIVEVAKQYVLQQDPSQESWLGTNTFHRPAAAGYRALSLLLTKDPHFLLSLPAEAWKRWAGTILSFWVTGEEKEKVHRLLLALAYAQAHEEILSALTILIDKENKDHSQVFITQKLDHVWDERLAAALLEKAKDPALSPKAMASLLKQLLTHGAIGARAFAASFVGLPLPPSAELRQRAVESARVLMAYAEDGGWDVVWPAIESDDDFGREVVTGLAYRSDNWRGGETARRLSAPQLADLYIWLCHQFPHAEDPKFDQAHSVTARESVGRWRDGLLMHLEERGTYEAVEAIERVRRELPHLDWMRWHVLAAQQNARRMTWSPPQPRVILALAEDHQRRFVESGEQLLDVVVESLRRLQEKLHGETPAAVDLWNQLETHLYRPKDENQLSDYIKRHLTEDLRHRGVVANREVEIRRGSGGAPGERTDIHVDAVKELSTGDAYDTISAIIEVKGAWNPKLLTDMEDQLVARYLKDNRCKHGLYLVGWFNCPQWDNKDERKHRTTSQLPLPRLQADLDAQAEDVSHRTALAIRSLVLNCALR